MSQYKSQIQNMFLSMVRKKHQPVEVILNTGTTLRGKVKGYDQFSITLIFKDKSEVIYKSAILYITALPKRKRPFPPAGPAVGGPRRFPAPGAGPATSAPRPPKPPPRMYIDDDRDPPPPRKTPRTDQDPPPPRKPPRSI
ncbi:MAG: hypothetical protein GX442_03370 [Candidatus Riflebacteria bacterium]|nr:hypothetical protein [Candidatus Riflebacteria bacterium]